MRLGTEVGKERICINRFVPNGFCNAAGKTRKVYEELGCIQPKKYDGWSGDLVLISILVLRERAKFNDSYSSYDKDVSKEKELLHLNQSDV